VAVRRDIVAYMALEGTVVAPPTAQATLYSPYRTTVKQVRASVNDRVDKGDVLLELTMPSAEVALQQAKDAVRSAELDEAAARRTASSGIDAARARVRAAETALRAVEAAPPAADPAEADSSSPAPSPGRPPAESSDREAAVSELEAAQAALAQAEAELQLAVAPARDRLEAARANLREAQAGRAEGFVRAPIAGTVVLLNATEGQEVGEDAKQPLAQIVNLRQLRVHALLTPEQQPNARDGTPVKLKFAELPNQLLDGEVERVTSVSDDSGRVTRYTAVVDFDNRERLVRPGWEAEVSVKLGAVEDVVAVPAEAVDRGEGDQWIVEVRRGGTWERVPVQLGLSDGTYTEIRQGVREGEEVRVTPSLLGGR
jgi:RND family efflux transporter MFP subunit